MNIFIPVSNTCALLPMQVYMCQKYLPGWGIHLLYSPHVEYTVPTKFVSPIENSHVISYKIPSILCRRHTQPGQVIYNWIVQKFLPEFSGYKLLIHSDLFPVKPVDVDFLLQNKLIASRTCGEEGESGLWTWYLFHPDYDTSQSKMNGMCLECRTPIQPYDAIRIKKDNNPLNGLNGYKDMMGFEWCDPYWLHSDKIGFTSAEYPIELKLDVLKNYFTTQHGYQGEYEGELCAEINNPISDYVEDQRQDHLSQWQTITDLVDSWNGMARSQKRIKTLFREKCFGCKHFRKITNQHGVCELAKAPVKTDQTPMNILYFATAKCPIDKWDAEEGEKPELCKETKKKKTKVAYRRKWNR